MIGEESIQVQSRVKPDSNFLDERKKIEKIINTKQNYNDFSSNREEGLSGEVFPTLASLRPTGHEYELPISKVQMKQVIETVESLEDQMKDEMKRNSTYLPKLQQYQVYEDVKEFVPEQPIREGDEYIFDMGKSPETFLLPPNQKPQTLHNVLRPNSPKPMGNMRPPFRRPVPPEIKIRRPFPMQKGNSPYPLPMPNLHSSHPHGMPKKPNKYHNNRPPHNMSRPQQSNVTPMKAKPSMHQSKPIYNQGPPKHVQKVPSSHVQPIVVGKPAHNIVLPSQSQTLSLGHTDIIANQVVKSQITLPGANDAVAQQSIPQIFLSKPGQIILGKPMDHPLPLDQQLILSDPQPTHSSTLMPEIIYHSSTSRPKEHIQNEIRSSDFMGQSADSSTFSPAVNTGFKPDSIVIESGFKPIIREPLMAEEDKIAEYDGNSANRREDTDIEEEAYEEAPQYINGNNHAYPSDKITETFEPMFIPSPPDHLQSGNERTKEVFPSNHAKEDRPHPVYVKTENELNALFGKKNMEREAPSDMMMESDKLSPQYLPPVTKLSKEQSQKLSSEQTFTTYDGKTISAASLTGVPEVKYNSKLFSSKLPANTELLLKTPQFGPFKGEIPPVVAEHIQPDVPSFSDLNNSDKRTTHLKLANSLHKVNPPVIDDLTAEGSQRKEDKVQSGQHENEEEEEDKYEEDGLEDEESKRRKRDTKAALFEASKDNERTTEVNRNDNDSINHVEFEAVASASRIYSTLSCFIIFNVLRRLF